MLAASKYIHFIHSNYTGPKPQSVNLTQVKKEIVDRFVIMSQNKIASQNNNQTLTEKELATFLKDISSNNTIGVPVGQAIQDTLFINDKQSLIPTGSNIAIRENLQVEEPKIPEQAKKIHQQLEFELNQIIILFQKTGHDILVSQLKNLSSGSPIPQDVAVRDNVTVIPKEEISLADMNCLHAAQTLQQSLNQLAIIGEIGSNKKTYQNLLKSIQGCMSKIGGHLFEVAVPYLTSQANNKGFYTINKAMQQAFINSGGKVIKTDGTNFVKNNFIPKQGQENSADIEMTFSNDKVVYTLNTQLKLSQSKNVLKGKSPSPMIGTTTIGNLVSLALNRSGQSRNVMQWYEASVGAVFEDNSKTSRRSLVKSQDEVMSWEIMKEYGLFSYIVDLLVGGDDVTSLYIVNNRVYSMYDILVILENTFSLYGSSSIVNMGSSPYTATLQNTRKTLVPRFPKWINTPASEIIPTRLSETKTALTQLYDTKVNISLSTAKLNSFL